MPRTTARLAVCAALHPASAVAVAACSFALSAATTEPGGLTLIQITPAGEFGPGDGRPMDDVPAWRIDAASAQAVIDRHAARTQPVLIDYEHQTLHKEKNGQPAPAAGWVRELRWIEGRGLFGAVALTERARTAITAGEYLYFSPVFFYSTEDGTVLELRMGALTNDPGIHGMQPLTLQAAATAAFLSSTPPPEPTPVNPLLKALLLALGLPETTTETAALAALTAVGPLKPLQARAGVAGAACTALKLPADATAEAVASACDQLRQAQTQAPPATPDPAKFVPIEAVTELQTQITALTARQQTADVDALVKPALADGRLLPAMEKWARELGAKDFAALTAYIGAAQPLAALTGTQTGGLPPTGLAKGDSALSADELAVCSAMGLTPEQYKAGAPA
jgi:phage I-like protein